MVFHHGISLHLLVILSIFFRISDHLYIFCDLPVDILGQFFKKLLFFFYDLSSSTSGHKHGIFSHFIIFLVIFIHTEIFIFMYLTLYIFFIVSYFFMFSLVRLTENWIGVNNCHFFFLLLFAFFLVMS